MQVRNRVAAFILVSSLFAVSVSPAGCYLSRGAWEEGKILARRRPIAELVADPRVDPVVRHKLQVVVAAREYARDSLRLRTKESFTTYSRLDKDTLVLVLSAAYRDRLEPYTWWFPIVGRVPYKGYFDFEEARRAARKFYEDGYDVSLRPSDAFSTLGWFNDPLLSTSLKRDSVDLAKTVIHELTHNTFYAPGSAPFNESFATFVGGRGAAGFFRSRGQTAAAARADAAWEDEKLLGEFWSSLARTLDSAYAAHPDSREARVGVRDTVYSRARAMLVSEIAPRLRTVSPLYAERVPLDNAALLARRVYARDLNLFDAIYAREGANLKRAIGRIIALAKGSPKDPYGGLRQWLAAFPVAPIAVSLEDVVTTATGETARRREVGSAVSTLQPKQENRANAQGASQLLSGKVPGVNPLPAARCPLPVARCPLPGRLTRRTVPGVAL